MAATPPSTPTRALHPSGASGPVAEHACLPDVQQLASSSSSTSAESTCTSQGAGDGSPSSRDPATSETSDTIEGPPLKRRRLCGKQTVVTQVPDPEAARAAQRACYRERHKARGLYATRVTAQVMARVPNTSACKGRRRQLWMQVFKESSQRFNEIGAAEQERWVLALRQQQKPEALPGCVDHIAVATSTPAWQESSGCFDSGAGSQVGFLVTFNGSWGLTDEWVQDTVRQQLDVETTTVRLQALPGPRDTFNRFWSEMEAAGEQVGLKHVSCAMEWSTKAQAAGRLHLHAFFSYLGHKTRGSLSVSAIRFEGFAPSHVSLTGGPNGGGFARRGRAALLHQGHFYLQMRKVGSVHRRTNFVKSLDFPVKQGWILLQWQQRKISHKDARLEIIDSRDRVHRGLQAIEQQERAEAQPAAQAASARLCRPELLPFKKALPLEVEWLAQYASLEAGQSPLRFRCLVYDGPSRTGKTQRAMHWFGADGTLRLNCQGVAAPSMQRWVGGGFRAVVFDEGGWELVHGNKMLFQAGPDPVELGQSPCGAYTYSVLVYGVPMVITSNDFWKGCPAAGEVKDWLTANIFYVHWDTPVYEEKPGEALPPE